MRVWETGVVSLNPAGNAGGDGLKGYDTRGNWTDTINFPPRAPSPASTNGIYRWQRPKGSTSMQVPFWPSALLTLDARHFIWRKPPGNEYRIVRTTFTGDTVLVVETQRPKVPVSQAERDSVVAHVRKIVGEQDWSQIPAEKPVFDQMFVSDDGDLWVRISTPENDRTTFDVFGDDGRYKGTVAIPLRVFRSLNPVVRGDRIWALVQDDLDVFYIIRGRLAEYTK